jgi:hypothetical protein
MTVTNHERLGRTLALPARRTVTEARMLRFDTHEFESE